MLNMTIRTFFIIGIWLFLFILISGQGMAADPPYVKDGAPTEVTFEEDGSNLTLNLYDVFADDDPEDSHLVLSNFEAEGIDVSIHPETGDVNITGEEDWNGQLELVFRAMDGRGYFAEHTVNVTVLPVNDPPEPLGKIPREYWWEGHDHHFNISQFFIDIEGDDLYYFVEVDPDVFHFNNTDNDPRNPWFDILPKDPRWYGYLRVTFTAYDKDPEVHPEEGLSATQMAIFEVKAVNTRPFVDYFFPRASVITINETESQVFSVPSDIIYDYDSTVFRWYWYVNDRRIEDVSGESFEFPQEPGHQDEGTYIIKCVVKDNLGEPALESPIWTLNILDVNLRPTVDLVVDQLRVVDGEIITLAAVGSDVDGDDLTYRWYRLTEDERAKGIGDGDWFVCESDLPPGRHYFRCEVSDGKATAESDWMLVTVEEVETPGPSGMLAMLALLIASIALAIVSRTRNGHSKAY